MIYNGKKILVTGATGMVGTQLLELLVSKGAIVTAVSLDNFQKFHDLFQKNVIFINGDLRNLDFCLEITRGIDFVFHLAGIKGSPLLTREKPNTFFFNTSLLNLNVFESCLRNNVPGILYTSSVGVYAQAEILNEEVVWKTFPSENDKFAGWAKRMGELQLEAIKTESNLTKTYIVRPANVYGPWDNFNPLTGMVVPSLIARACSGENPLSVWGDGSTIRDFIHARDVARAILFVVDKQIEFPVNVGSGSGVKISELVRAIQSNFPGMKVHWDSDKPTGDRKRILNTTKLSALGFKLEVDLATGIKETIEWFLRNGSVEGRYDAFTETLK